ncbi:MAG: polyribonucleotide nucleotidyltransferase, partial [Deltaproteobacteria bacterium]|nr:polyribonucleotide nucleotidyltransferase [Deltaproteobacteria bacterium]
MCETQVIATVMSADAANQSDVLAMIGASAAIHISPLPWAGPIAGVRVASVEGKLIANPTYQEQENSDCELLISASKDAIVMVEGEANEMSEDDLIAAIQFGHESVQGVLELIEKIREAVGKEKWPFQAHKRDEKIDTRVKEVGLQKVIEACNIAEKHPRYG